MENILKQILEFFKNFSNERGHKVGDLPPHLFIPYGAESVDLRNLVEMSGSTIAPVEILSFKVPENQTLVITGYSVYSDVELESDVEFVPTIDGLRVLKFHGNPNYIDSIGAQRIRMSLGLAPDLSTLIPCYLRVQGGQTIKWTANNSGSLLSFVGVRISGYIDSSNKYRQTKFGG